jgi:peptide chain release factor 1
VTVAVLPEPTDVQVRLDDRDLEYRTCRASGAGGQKVNKTDSAVQLTHKPTGLMVRVETERSQHQNRATALALLRARLWQTQRDAHVAARADDRRGQVGSGMRGDKRRTIAVQRGTVVDHVTGRSWNLRDYLRGAW